MSRIEIIELVLDGWIVKVYINGVLRYTTAVFKNQEDARTDAKNYKTPYRWIDKVFLKLFGE